VSSTKFTTTEEAFQYNTISQQTAENAFEKVLKYAGASLSRDDVDTRVADDAKNGTGNIIDYTSPLIKWNELKGEKIVDTDRDGMPDDFEIKHGLDPQRANANDYDLDEKKYYTNLEVYANSLVEDIMKAERENAEETFEEYYPTIGKIASQIYYFTESGNAIQYLDGAKVQITGNESKSYGAASDIVYNDVKYKSVKLSNGAQNTFYAPEGKTISSVKIISYKHGTGERVSFWYEVNGTEYGTMEIDTDNKATFTPFDGTAIITEVDDRSKKLCSTPNVQEYSIGGKSSFTFTNGGEQLGFILDVTYGEGEATGINDFDAPIVAKTQKARKFFQNGRLVIETANGTFTVAGARVR
jgi:hypothetical protein